MKTAVFSLIILLFSSLLALAQVEQDRVLINTSVVDFKQKPLAGETISFTNTKTGKVISKLSDKEGKCFFVLYKGNEYIIRYKNFGKTVDYSKIQIPQIDRLKELKVVVKFQKAKAYTLDNVLFETGKAGLKGTSFKSLDELVEAMNAKPRMVIEIAGHTDNIGDENTNLRLSQERAETVRGYLVKRGISPNRVTARGYGDTKPVASNNTEAGRRQNRRTEVKIIRE